ncbi:MAG: DUF177 domain-containing protein [Verrucomicrobia bacterium]|nr:DUF177 domain-containing protein [Verrucomicrobiota bacterium]
MDLTEDIREAVLLKVPNFPLCSSQCKGVCLQCGQDLNAGTCACEPPHWENRWGALDQLDSK